MRYRQNKKTGRMEGSTRQPTPPAGPPENPPSPPGRAACVAAPPPGGGLAAIHARYRDAAAGLKPEMVEATHLSCKAEALLAAVDAAREGDDTRLGHIQEVLQASEIPGRYLLAFGIDAAGDVRAAVACGNPASATHSAVFVPGIEAGAEDMVRLARHADNLRILSDAQRAADGRQGATCIIVWAGYRSPTLADSFDRGHSPASYTPAVSGAAALAEFCRRWMPGGAGTIVGHSYGSVVAASAIRFGGLGKLCSNFVAAGSPGFGDGYQSPEGTEVYVAEAAADPVAALGWFGGDPGDQGGARRLHTGKSHVAQRTWGHTKYFDEGTTAQWNIAAVAGGNLGRLVESAGENTARRLAGSALRPLKKVVSVLAGRYHGAGVPAPTTPGSAV